jgi:hypothetical protein
MSQRKTEIDKKTNKLGNMWHRKKEEHGGILREGKLGKTHIFGEAWLLQDDKKKKKP